MSKMEFFLGGRIVSADTVKAQAMYAPRPIKAKKEKPASYHNGWAVEGFPPGFFQAAMDEAVKRFAAWCALTPQEQAKRTRDGTKAPKEWNEQAFVSNTKAKRVRSKPYEIESAANECMALAVKAGWTHVRVVELSAGEKPAGLL